jgi:hypothetical protein
MQPVATVGPPGKGSHMAPMTSSMLAGADEVIEQKRKRPA